LSAEQGDAFGQRALALMYANGKGITQDLKKAFKWFTLSAEQGDSIAQYSLGMMYLHYQSVAQEKRDKEGVKKAFKWFELAAEQGHSEALGLIYDKKVFEEKLKLPFKHPSHCEI
jgi:uncharacterized protein